MRKTPAANAMVLATVAGAFLTTVTASSRARCGDPPGGTEPPLTAEGLPSRGASQQGNKATASRLAPEQEERLKEAARLSRQACELANQGKPREAVTAARDVLRTCEEILGPEHLETSRSRYALAVYYKALGEYAQAKSLLAKAREIQRKTLGENHPEYAVTLGALAQVYLETEEHARAAALLVEATEILRRSRGEDHPQHAAMLIDLAVAYRGMGEYAQAESLLMKAREIQRKTLGEKHPHYAITLSNLANVYLDTAEYATAEALLLEACEIDKQTLGEDHPQYACGLNNLANVYRRLGEYAKAEALWVKFREIQRRTSGPKHPEYATALNNLAMMYFSIGEYAKAEPLLLEMIEIQGRTLGPWHPRYASGLVNLGALYRSRGEYLKAEAVCLKARDIQRKRLGENHPDYANTLNNLATLYNVTGRYAEAEALYLEAREIRQRTLGQMHPSYAATLHNLGGLYASMGQYTQAETLYLEAAEICKRRVGQKNHEYVVTLKNLCALYVAAGESDKALASGTAAARIENELAAEVFTAFSEAESLNYAAQELRAPNELMSAWRHAKRPVDEVYGLVWPRRGMIQMAASQRQRTWREAATPQVRALYGAYVQTRKSLARLTLAPVQSDPQRSSARIDHLQQLSEEKDRLEHQLAAELPEFGRHVEALRRPYTDLLRVLPKDSTFVDLLPYCYFEQDPRTPGQKGSRTTVSYAAFLLSSGAPLAWVDLGPVAPIDEAIRAWREEIAAGRNGAAPSEILRHELWQPIESRLPAGTRVVYVFPEGALTGLPWGALPGKRSGTVLLEEYAFAVVPAGQFLLDQLRQEHASVGERGTLLAVGDVAYGEKPHTAAAKPGVAVLRAAGEAARTGNEPAWPPLEATAQELAGIFAVAAQRDRRKLSGAEASTLQVMAELPQASRAHFATHGFFADPKFRSMFQLDERVFERRNTLYGARSTVAGRNPLVLSGLVLAGANLPRPKDGFGIPQGDGGILTAEVIACLPLDKLELAVLSACDTGLGNVAGGEGVLGLARAFHVAGAHNVIASLWKVEDRATAVLMQQFYRNLWVGNLSPLESLRQAQLYIYRHPEAVGLSRGPDLDKSVPLPKGTAEKPTSATARTRQWAAFVLSGSGR